MFDLLQGMLLERRPTDPTGTLRAWNAADAHLLASWKATQASKALLVNDAFGALSCAMLTLHNEASIEHWNDSVTSRKAAQNNMRQNGLDGTRVRWTPLTSLPQPTPAAWMKIPHSLSRLSWQLESLQTCMPKDFTLFAGVMCKYESKKMYEILNLYFESVMSDKAVRKGRLITCRDLKTKKAAPADPWTSTPFPERGWRIASLPGVFAQEKIDVGSRFLLQHLPKDKVRTTLDLGCGNGLLGLAVLANDLTDRMVFVDESLAAVASSRQTLTWNLPDKLHACSFLADDDLSSLTANSVDRILCNPPFHQNGAVTEQISRHLFKEARRVLRPAGEMFVIANRHLGYGTVLGRLFGGFQVVASNRKFIVFRCVKRQRGPSRASRGFKKTVS